MTVFYFSQHLTDFWICSNQLENRFAKLFRCALNDTLIKLLIFSNLHNFFLYVWPIFGQDPKHVSACFIRPYTDVSLRSNQLAYRFTKLFRCAQHDSACFIRPYTDVSLRSTYFDVLLGLSFNVCYLRKKSQKLYLFLIFSECTFVYCFINHQKF